MKVALYYPWVYLTSGAERTILEIANRSRHEVTIFTNRFQPDTTFPEFRSLDVRVLGNVSVKRSLTAVGGAAATILRQKIDLDGFDVLLVVCEGLGDLVALRHRKTRAYCLCLTPLRIVYDAVYRDEYLRRRGVAHRLAIGFGSLAYRALDRAAWRRYRRIFPISAEIQRRILAGGLAPMSRLQILHPGIDADAFEPSAAAERTFFVPGRIMWTKNLELGIEAFRIFRASMPDPGSWRLRFAGIVDRKSLPYLDKLRALADGDPAIEFLVHPSDEQMRAQYRRCFATLFTAFNEDWGLVILEAMASGKPPIAVNRGGPLEIVRPEHDGLLARPEPAAFAGAMLRLARDRALYRCLAANGPDSAARFGWGSFVSQLDTALETDVRPGVRVDEWQGAWQETGT
jgi:glycosyltransferase involved in cell wall biosynthesis